MIISLLAILTAFYWLLRETDYLRIRLPVGKSAVKQTEVTAETKPDNPYYWMPPELRETQMILCHNCRVKCDKENRWIGWKVSARTIKFHGSTLNLAEGCNIKRAKLLKAMAREVKRKTYTLTLTPLPAFVETERIGSHQEWIETTPKHGFHRTVEEYTTNFKPCLCGKDWLEAHYKDEYPEPTIELSVNGKTLSLNGNYKTGVIKAFCKANKEAWE